MLKKVSPALVQGWEVKEETLVFVDTASHRNARMRNLKLENPVLKKLQQESKKKEYTEADIAALAGSIDLSSLSPHDVEELCFAWGPDVFTKMITEALRTAPPVENLLQVGQLAAIRHGLLLALNR